MELLEIIWFVRRRRTSKKREKNSRKVVPDLLARNLDKVSKVSRLNLNLIFNINLKNERNSVYKKVAL